MIIRSRKIQIHDDFGGIFENTYINCAESVTIGKYFGIGQNVKIWTHGAWLPVTDFLNRNNYQ